MAREKMVTLGLREPVKAGDTIVHSSTEPTRKNPDIRLVENPATTGLTVEDAALLGQKIQERNRLIAQQEAERVALIAHLAELDELQFRLDRKFELEEADEGKNLETEAKKMKPAISPGPEYSVVPKKIKPEEKINILNKEEAITDIEKQRREELENPTITWDDYENYLMAKQAEKGEMKVAKDKEAESLAAGKARAVRAFKFLNKEITAKDFVFNAPFTYQPGNIDDSRVGGFADLESYTWKPLLKRINAKYDSMLAKLKE